MKQGVDFFRLTAVFNNDADNGDSRTGFLQDNLPFFRGTGRQTERTEKGAGEFKDQSSRRRRMQILFFPSDSLTGQFHIFFFFAAKVLFIHGADVFLSLSSVKGQILYHLRQSTAKCRILSSTN